MADIVTDRLRAARPPAADVPDDAFDAVLLARLLAQPPARGLRTPRRARLALPAAGIVAAAVLALTAGSDRVANPASAAIVQAQRWFDPAPGTILHFRSELTSATPDGGHHTLIQEIWQSADHPERQRHVERDGDRIVETAGEDVYDPATNKIYEHVPPGPRQRAQIRTAIERKLAAAKAQGASADVIRRLHVDARKAQAGTLEDGAGAPLPAGDPGVGKIRMLLRRGDASVRARERHDGVEAWAIALEPGPQGEGAPHWTLWTAASDGRPLELRIDNGPGTPILESTRWTTYETLPGDEADRLLTLTGAHPDARVGLDPERLDAARQRLFPKG